jgi:hypothetical protein
VWLRKEDQRWSAHFSGPDDCLDVIDDAEQEEGADKPNHDYKFYLNEDNRALHFELAANRLAAEAIKKQFEIAVTLIGLSILHDADRAPQGEEQLNLNGGQDSENLETGRNRVMRATRAIAPVLLPMINTLSDLGQFEVDESDLVGQAA